MNLTCTDLEEERAVLVFMATVFMSAVATLGGVSY